MSGASGRGRRFILPAILLLAALLRFYRLSFQSLWSDEGNSLALARAGFAEIAQRTAFDIHPPLYYWLLKLWTGVFGFSETGLRSLSATLGVALVLATAGLGARLFGKRVGLAAALIAALSPFQVYYAQETRMYMLLALLGTIAVWAGLEVMGKTDVEKGLIYVVAASLGLYTHYAFPIILAAINLAALSWLWQTRSRAGWSGRAGRWALLQLLPLLVYALWLPVAWRQIRTWPNLSQAATPAQIALTTFHTLSFGSSFEAANVLPLIVPGLLLAGGVAGLRRHRPRVEALAVLLWLALPLALSFFLFRPAYLKFLLAASPAFSLILALGLARPAPLLLRSALLALLLYFSAASLGNYYFDPAYQRDNYRGIAAFIEAVAGPGDAVILNAPGQQEVFGYYFEGNLPVYPLPRSRPPDAAATLAELAGITGRAGNIYAVYWAAEEADPDGLIERRLAQQAFKAGDWWYGNVRLVSYTVPPALDEFTPIEYRFGESIRLTGFSLPHRAATPGRILPLALRWQTGSSLPPEEDYIVFIQILDQNNHVAGQRDARPQPPTTGWQAGQTLLDRHGIYLKPGTPPGEYRLIAGLYDAATGQRLPVSGGETDFVELARLEVTKPAVPLPEQAFAVQHPLQTGLFEMRWLGYDLYKVGHASDPETPLHSGDPLHLVLYLKLERPAPQLSDQLLLQVVTPRGQPTGIEQAAPLSGTDYPLKDWAAGEIVRAQFDLFLSALPPGSYRVAVTLSRPDGSAPPETALTGPFRVE
ncbi:MAG: glycosyltransferase family 39 protein [Anaerolineae bacterium]